MAQLYKYGATDPVYFKVTLAGVGVAGITLAAADVKLGLDGAAAVNIGASCTETTFGLGWYKWTPANASQTQGKTAIINVKDSVSTAFDENGILLVMGGNAAALYDGT